MTVREEIYDILSKVWIGKDVSLITEQDNIIKIITDKLDEKINYLRSDAYNGNTDPYIIIEEIEEIKRELEK